MKKLIFTLCCLAALCPAYAQDEAYEPQSGGYDLYRLRFGAYIAPNASWMQPTASKSDDGAYAVSKGGSILGYTWGLMAEYYFAPSYGFVTGFQVNNTGGSLQTSRINTQPAANTVYRTDFEYHTQYLEVPVALKLRTSPLGMSGVRAFGQIGVTGGVNIGKKVTYEVDYTGSDPNQMLKASGDREKLSGSLTMAPAMLALNLGTGIEYPLARRLSLYFGVFFNNGFLPDATYPDKYSLGYQGSFKDGNIRLNNLAFRFGLFF